MPRSEGPLVMPSSQSNDTLYMSSPMSDYSATMENGNGAGQGNSLGPNRHSTTDALQYYWSSSAGERKGSKGSLASSSIGFSPIDSSNPKTLNSPYTLSPHPALGSPLSTMPANQGFHERSDMSLRELVDDEQTQERLRGDSLYPLGPGDSPGTNYADPRMYVPHDHHAPSEAGPSNRRIHIVSYPSDGGSSAPSSQQSHSGRLPRSLSGVSTNSGDSEYSLPDDEAAHHAPRDAAPSNYSSPYRNSPSAPRGQRPRAMLDPDTHLDMLLDPSFEEWSHQRAWAGRDSSEPRSSSTPISPAPRNAISTSDLVSPSTASDETWHTPTPTSSLGRRAHIHRTPSPRIRDNDRTPRNSHHGPRSSSGGRRSGGGRAMFVAPSDVSRNSLDALEREISSLGLETSTRRSRVMLSVADGGRLSDDVNMPRSAPPEQSSFGDISSPTEPRRVTSLLPSVTVASPNPRALSKLAIPDHMSPSQDSARNSPEPPPRSDVRKHRSRTPSPAPTPVSKVFSSPRGSPSSTEMMAPPPLPTSDRRTQTLPTIINTPHTPLTSPQAAGRDAAVRRSPRSNTVPVPGSPNTSSSPPTVAKSGTIQDLTDMLGGAIDEIGLMDSKDTPPPTVTEPEKVRTPLSVSQVPMRGVSTNATVMPTHTPDVSQRSSPPDSVTSPNRGIIASSPIGLGIMSTVGAGVAAGVAAAAGAAAQRTNVARHVRKASSILSLKSQGPSQLPSPGPALGGLTSAIMYSRIKELKTSGERARGYAQAIEGLQRADSGLREWIFHTQYPQRVVAAAAAARPAPAPKAAAMSQLGLRPPEEPAGRNVSTSSEFPMRPDAYTARELSVRNLDMQDAPTALPTNLPYPQLQNIKGSASVTSLASVSSHGKQRGLGRAFNFLKREKENASLATLGPSNPSYVSLSGTQGTGASGSAGGPKPRDMRNMPISPPAHPVSPGGRNSLDSPDGRTHPSLSVPRGPREPGRHSFDGGRGSLDGGSPTGLGPPRTSSRSSPGPPGGPHGTSPLAARDGNGGYEPTEDEVRALADLLPAHSETAVVRAYLQRYAGNALTAYLDDEKNGTLLRA